MLAKILRVIGWILFAICIMVGLGSFFEMASMKFPISLLVISIVVAGILLLADWLENKSHPKKVSIFAVLCFILGVLSVFPYVPANWYIMWKLIASVLSITCGVIFIISKNKQGNKEIKLLGFPLFLIGFIFGLLAPVCILLLILAGMPSFL